MGRAGVPGAARVHSPSPVIRSEGLPMRLTFAATAFVTLLSAAGPAAAVDFAALERRIAKEPAYQSPPLYGLALVGPKGETRVWMALDGERLYLEIGRASCRE